jgi:hypothetical protein
MKVRQLLCVLPVMCVRMTIAYAGPQAGGPEAAGPEDLRPLTFYALARNTYNDNIYSLPADVSIADLQLAPGAARADWIQTGAIGLDGLWNLGAQQLSASLQADYNRFQHNNLLNNASTEDKVQWLWRVGPRLSGKLYANYGQNLAGFANTRFFSKDILKTLELYGEVDWELGPHWILKAGGRRATTDHTADHLKVNDFASNAGTFDIDYVTDDANTLGWEYRRVRGSFPRALDGATVLANRGYSEDAGNFHTEYQLTGKTAFEGRVGYLRRRYSDPQAEAREGDFSGTVWRAALLWQATAKTQLALTGWRDLTAYIDAQSDYFVATAARISALWNATEAISVAAGLVRERDHYVSANPDLAFTDARRDSISSAQGLLTWTPRRFFSAQLAYRYSKRDSTVGSFDYRYNTISLELRLVL